MAELLYSKAQMSGGEIDTLLDIHRRSGGSIPFTNRRDLYGAIDELTVGDLPWQSFTVRYNGDPGIDDDLSKPRPKWMSDVHEVFYRDPRLTVHEMLANPSYEGSMDFSPYRAFDQDGGRRYEHLMSGDWAWNQAVSSLKYAMMYRLTTFQNEIARDPKTHGSMFVPIILGSDKTTVSVATGQTDYYPVYLSIGNIHNNIRRSHRGGVALIGFLAIAKSEFSFNLANNLFFCKDSRERTYQ